MKKLLGIVVLGLVWCNIGIAEELFTDKKFKLPITPKQIAKWDYTCDKEDFKKYVATVEGCMALQHLGKIDKSKKKLVVFMHGDRKSKDDYKIKGWWTFSKVIKDEKKNIYIYFFSSCSDLHSESSLKK